MPSQDASKQIFMVGTGATGGVIRVGGFTSNELRILGNMFGAAREAPDIEAGLAAHAELIRIIAPVVTEILADTGKYTFDNREAARKFLYEIFLYMEALRANSAQLNEILDDATKQTIRGVNDLLGSAVRSATEDFISEAFLIENERLALEWLAGEGSVETNLSDWYLKLLTGGDRAIKRVIITFLGQTNIALVDRAREMDLVQLSMYAFRHSLITKTEIPQPIARLEQNLKHLANFSELVAGPKTRLNYVLASAYLKPLGQLPDKIKEKFAASITSGEFEEHIREFFYNVIAAAAMPIYESYLDEIIFRLMAVTTTAIDCSLPVDLRCVAQGIVDQVFIEIVNDGTLVAEEIADLPKLKDQISQEAAQPSEQITKSREPSSWELLSVTLAINASSLIKKAPGVIRHLHNSGETDLALYLALQTCERAQQALTPNESQTEEFLAVVRTGVAIARSVHRFETARAINKYAERWTLATGDSFNRGKTERRYAWIAADEIAEKVDQLKRTKKPARRAIIMADLGSLERLMSGSLEAAKQLFGMNRSDPAKETVDVSARRELLERLGRRAATNLKKAGVQSTLGRVATR